MTALAPGVPVVVLPGGNLLAKRGVSHDVVAHGPFDLSGEQVVRLASDWRHVPVAHLRPHWLAGDLAGLEQPRVIELDFPNPPCSRCHEETESDGDGWVCPYCLASWPYSGSGGTFQCVEDQHHEATLLGADSQPRCALCEVRVRAGEIEPTGPYTCRGCREEVYGIGLDFDTETARTRRCAGCTRAEQHRKFMEDLISKSKRRGT